MGQLSDSRVRAARSADTELFLNDGMGLYLRVRSSGTKQWLYRYKSDGRTRWVDIGVYPDTGLADARLQAATFSAKRRQGIDPIEEREAESRRKLEQEQAAAQAVAAEAARLSVQSLFERWEQVELSCRKDKGAEARRCFKKDILPTLGDIPAEDVTRAMIAAALDKVSERGARIVARNLLGDLRQMFGFAIKRGSVENDPTSHLKRDDFGRKVERDRVLSESEIKLLAKQLPLAGMCESSVAAIWIMLSTCCRIGEITSARVADIDLDAAAWRIPPEHSKNGKEHLLFLPAFALEHFRFLKARAEKIGSEWLCPAKNKSKENHVCPKSLAKQVGDRQRGDKSPMKHRSPLTSVLTLPGGHWTPHDLRRTGATIMGSIGVRPDVIEKCLNHVEQNRLVRIYQRQELREEQREAWKLLGSRLEALLSEL